MVGCMPWRGEGAQPATFLAVPGQLYLHPKPSRSIGVIAVAVGEQNQPYPPKLLPNNPHGL